jgi:hypothetical protein
MSEVKLPSTSSVRDIIDIYKGKLEANIIPPDPARIIEVVLRGPLTIEHILPIPSIIEYVHSNFTKPLVEALPRLPMTADFPEYQFLKWIKEEFKV